MAALHLAPRHLATLRALLAQHAPQADVWAYGSRVTGGAHEGSDLDLVLRGATETAPPVAALVEALQASDLPMLVEVHDWAHLPVAFRAEIERGFVVVQVGRVAA
jgi:predicted nucleotidyltransferase